MRITESNITMASGRRYTERGMGYSREEKSASALNDIFSQFAQQAADRESVPTPLNAQAEAGPDSATKGVTGRGGGDLQSELIGIKNSLLQELLKRMLSSGMFGGRNGTFGGFGQSLGFGASGGIGGLGVSMSAGGLSFTQTTYAEEETTAFLAMGCAKTEDGRQIDFDINLLMSRSFMQYTQINVPLFSDALFDPLMINVGSAITRLSSQTFRFDLDMDGEEDNIAMPEAGTGFLALDLNEDGKINDGSELFGVKSGNGFEDLAQYDSDGNGWIDENDEVFSKLKVWYKNGDGTDELVDLKTADVGAIYLGNRQTDFSLYGSAFQLSGMVRATGLFLKESGGVGTVQHVDLALQEDAGPGAGALAVPGTESDMTQKTESDRRKERVERSKRRAEEESERRKAYHKRRAEKEALNKETAARLQKRKELRREELEALFADREEKKELYDTMLSEKQEEHNTLNSELLQTEKVNELVEEQMSAVA